MSTNVVQFPPFSKVKLREVLAKQNLGEVCIIFEENGELFMVNTFQNLEELAEALQGVRDIVVGGIECALEDVTT
jgi:hypothetical protein